VHGSLNRSFFKRHDLLTNVKFSRDYNRYIDPDYNTLEGALDNKYYQNELYASLVNQVAIFEWWDASLAADFSVNTLDANLYLFPYPTRYSYLSALSNRLKWERIDVQTSLLGGYIEDKVNDYRSGDSRKVFCPVVSASVQPFKTKTFRVRAFYKESFRMPTFNELYYTFIGNSSLRPEYATQYDLGATWVHNLHEGFLRSASIQADAYYNCVKDKIISMPSSNLFRWTMMNLGEVEIKGLDASTNFGFRLPAKVLMDLGLSYTFQKAIDISSEDGTYHHQIPYTPLHSGALTASARWQGLQLNYSFIYTGERYSQSANKPDVQPWYTHDIALVWEHKIMKAPMRMAAEINNLFNQYYDVVLWFPMPGRNYRFSLSINI
jgi:outer membrane receptor protein involved in Fe transport